MAFTLGGSTFGNLGGGGARKLGRPGGSTFGHLSPGPIGNFNPPRMRGLTGPGVPNVAHSAFGQLGIGTKAKPPGGGAGKPKVPKAPGVAPGSPPKAPGAAPGPPPLDSIAQANIAARIAGDNRSIYNTELGQAYNTTQLQASLAQLAYAQPRQSLQLEQQANARGGLYSSVYNQQLGNLNYDFAGKQAGLGSKYAIDAARSQSDIAGLQGDELSYAGQQAAGSAERASQQAANNPATGNGGSGGKGKGNGGGGGGGGGGQSPAQQDAQAAAQGARMRGKGNGRSAARQDAQRAAQGARMIGKPPKGSSGKGRVPKIKIYGGTG